jgi:1-pyrroline-4-hydroxy-2-carboxylate deaminase
MKDAMIPASWRGVIPAITTPFKKDMSIDLAFVRKHVALMVNAGCTGIVTPGSLGEGATLSMAERADLWRACVDGVAGRVPVVAAVAAAGTEYAAMIAREAEACACRGLMVLPPYLYKGSWREMKAHFAMVIGATNLSCMLYNNPIAYGVDVTPGQVAELAAAHANLHAVKESSGDVRRITAIRAECGERLAVLVGMDDLIVEGIAAGAVGWIAGLVNALPRESVRLFELARDGKRDEVERLYKWFLPLLRMDTTYDFVQLIKLVQAEAGMVGEGGAAVRLPRMLPEGKELERVRGEIRRVLADRQGAHS